MQNNQTKPIHDRNSSTATASQSNLALGPRHVFKLGLDVDLHNLEHQIPCRCLMLFSSNLTA
jgi:hypothetical protein